jgi:HEPN domain-containing protein
MSKTPQEWLRQADYDMKTAEVMFDNGMYIYTVFMCHLSIEKALKGIHLHKLNEVPPKTHNLIFLVKKTVPGLPEELYDFILSLNVLSVPTRYPDNLRRMKKDYGKKKTRNILEKSKEALKWLKRESRK